jgi:hypothetical protein
MQPTVGRTGGGLADGVGAACDSRPASLVVVPCALSAAPRRRPAGRLPNGPRAWFHAHFAVGPAIAHRRMEDAGAIHASADAPDSATHPLGGWST